MFMRNVIWRLHRVEVSSVAFFLGKINIWMLWITYFSFRSPQPWPYAPCASIYKVVATYAWTQP